MNNNHNNPITENALAVIEQVSDDVTEYLFTQFRQAVDLADAETTLFPENVLHILLGNVVSKSLTAFCQGSVEKTKQETVKFIDLMQTSLD